MLSPQEHLDELEAAAATGRPLAPESARWFVAGVRRIHAGADAAESLALKGGLQRRARDLALRAAAAELCPDGERWEQARRLAKAARAFEANTWPGIRRRRPRDWGLSGYRLEIARALSAGKIPDVKQIHRILSE